MWGLIVNLYTVVFYQPILNALVVIYNVVPGHDLGVTIFLLTLAIRIVLYPLSLKSIRAQKAMQELQPKLDAIKQRYKDNREKQAEETMRLYREEKINPLSSCLPLLLQLPFLFALFHVFRDGTHDLSVLYSFVQNPGTISQVGFYGLVDLSKPNAIIAILAGLSQFWQGHMLMQRRPVVKNEATKDEDFATLMNQQMTYVMPLVTAWIAWTFPAGLGLYWFLSTFFLALQQWFLFRKKDTNKSSDENSSQTTPPLAS